jgi:hypothetical protein
LTEGIDTEKFPSSSYQESLSSTTKLLHRVASDVTSQLGKSPQFVGVGVVPGARQLVIYWAGPVQSPALSVAHRLASEQGVAVSVAPRLITRAQIVAATQKLERNVNDLERRGIYVDSFGGFDSTFDGISVRVDQNKSTQHDAQTIVRELQAAAGVPVNISFGSFAQ